MVSWKETSSGSTRKRICSKTSIWNGGKISPKPNFCQPSSTNLHFYCEIFPTGLEIFADSSVGDHTVATEDQRYRIAFWFCGLILLCFFKVRMYVSTYDFIIGYKKMDRTWTFFWISWQFWNLKMFHPEQGLWKELVMSMQTDLVSMQTDLVLDNLLILQHPDLTRLYFCVCVIKWNRMSMMSQLCTPDFSRLDQIQVSMQFLIPKECYIFSFFTRRVYQT